MFCQEESMARVQQICADHSIDLDDESDAPASQTTRNDDDPLFGDNNFDLDDIIGKHAIIHSLFIEFIHSIRIIWMFNVNPRWGWVQWRRIRRWFVVQRQ